MAYNENLRNHLRGEDALPEGLSWDSVGEAIYDGVVAADRRRPWYKSRRLFVLLPFLFLGFGLGYWMLSGTVDDNEVDRQVIIADTVRSGQENASQNGSNKDHHSPVVLKVEASGNNKKNADKEFVVSESYEAPEDNLVSHRNTSSAAATAENRIDAGTSRKAVDNEIDHSVFAEQAESQVLDTDRKQVEDYRVRPTGEASAGYASSQQTMVNSTVTSYEDSEGSLSKPSRIEGEDRFVDGPAVIANLSMKVLNTDRNLDIPAVPPALLAIEAPLHEVSRLELITEAGYSFWSGYRSGLGISEPYIHPVLSFHTALHGSIKMGRSSALSIGLRFRQLESQLDYYEEQDVLALGEVTIIETNALTGNVTTRVEERLLETISLREIRHRNRTQVLSVPVALTHQVTMQGPWSLSLGLGAEYILAHVQTGVELISNSDTGFFDALTLSGGDYPTARQSVLGSIHAAVDYSITPKWSARAGFRYSKSLRSWSTAFDIAPSIVDCSLGLSYRL